MLGPIIIFLITYVFIATEWIEKSAAALLGATAVIMLHYIPYEEALHKIDLNVIFLLIGMMMVVNILARTGFFEWISIMLAKVAKGNGMLILVFFLLATALISALLDNVTTVILIAPVTILLTQILEIPTVPVLILEAVYSNIGGTATMIGDPPNILIGSKTALHFNDFILNLGPIVGITLLVSIPMVMIIFRKQTRTAQKARDLIANSRPEAAILQPIVLRRALIILGLIIIGFLAGRVLDVEPGIVALGGAFLMAIVCKIDLHKIMEKVEWGTILFFVGLFMLIGALEHIGLFEKMGHVILDLCGGNLLATAIAILWFSALASAIVDNIPLVMAMIPLVKGIVPVFSAQMGIAAMPHLVNAQIKEPLLWALALGACLGGNGSLIGASANVVVAQIARQNNYKLTFWSFAKIGFPMMLLSLTLSTAYIYLRYF